jgi:hypothetical protein
MNIAVWFSFELYFSFDWAGLAGRWLNEASQRLVTTVVQTLLSDLVNSVNNEKHYTYIIFSDSHLRLKVLRRDCSVRLQLLING